MTDLDELRRLAEAATKGPWQLQDGSSWRRIGSLGDCGYSDGNVLYPCVSRTDGHPDLSAGRGEDLYANLQYIAAANPATVIALIDEIERLRKEMGR